MIGREPEMGKDVTVAVRLMRMALALLDRHGDLISAAWLQHAIDVAERNDVGVL